MTFSDYTPLVRISRLYQRFFFGKKPKNLINFDDTIYLTVRKSGRYDYEKMAVSFFV